MTVLQAIVCALQSQSIAVGTEPDSYYASAGQLWHDGWHGWLCILVNHQWIIDTDFPCCGIEDRGLHEGCLVRVGLITWAIGGIRGQQLIWSSQSLRRKRLRGHDQGTIHIHCRCRVRSYMWQKEDNSSCKGYSQ
jgi:hypothetical protein